MTREAVRTGFTDAIKALQGTYPGTLEIELPNQVELDPANQPAPFMKVRISYQDSFQASLGRQQHLRAIGFLIMECWVNIGKGTKPANDMMQHFYPSLHMTDTIPGVRTFAVKFTPNFQKSGWDVHPMVIPFWFDDTN